MVEGPRQTGSVEESEVSDHAGERQEAAAGETLVVCDFSGSGEVVGVRGAAEVAAESDAGGCAEAVPQLQPTVDLLSHPLVLQDSLVSRRVRTEVLPEGRADVDARPLLASEVLADRHGLRRGVLRTGVRVADEADAEVADDRGRGSRDPDLAFDVAFYAAGRTSAGPMHEEAARADRDVDTSSLPVLGCILAAALEVVDVTGLDRRAECVDGGVVPQHHGVELVADPLVHLLEVVQATFGRVDPGEQVAVLGREVRARLPDQDRQVVDHGLVPIPVRHLTLELPKVQTELRDVLVGLVRRHTLPVPPRPDGDRVM